ncbi:MAG: DUF6412 domain-containing protein [Rhodococcus sp. (in: high G+C Gram-positive bacteria)]
MRSAAAVSIWLTATVIATVTLLSIYLDPQSANASFLAIVIVLSAALIVAALTSRLGLLRAFVPRQHGSTDDEQRLRGSFRRQSHPDTAGRPMPRAPGALAGAQPGC